MPDPNIARGTPFRLIPPAAVPVKGGDIRRGLVGLFDPAGSLERFQSALSARMDGARFFGVSSGRAALTVILLALKQHPDRSEVVLPAYSCPTVVQAVLQAGLIPVFCDVSPETLDLDREALAGILPRKPLAIVATHLYGLAQDVRDLVALGREQGIYIVEDAAQAFGAVLDGGMVGTFGDAGFFSLGRGKCIPAGHGGVIAAGKRLGEQIAQTVCELNLVPAKAGLSALAAYMGYALATTPFGWWWIYHSPLNPAEAGMDIQRLPPIHLSGLSATHAALGCAVLDRLDDVHSIRRENARRLIDLLSGYDFISLPRIPAGSEPVFLRLPVILDSPENANRLYTLFIQSGIGVSKSYQRTLPDLYSRLPAARERGFPGASQLAGCLLTLPTHPFVRSGEFVRIKQVLDSAKSSFLGNRGGDYACPTAG